MRKAVTLLLLLGFLQKGYSQASLLSDTTRLKQTASGYTGILKNTTDKIKNTFTGKLKSLADSSKRKVGIQATLLTEANYISNSYVPPAGNGVYYKAGVEGAVTLGKIPFSAGVTFNLKDRQVIWNNTQFSFNFDSRKFINGIKSEYLSYLGDMKNFYSPEVAGQVMSYKDSVTKWQNLQNTLSDKNYYQTLQSLSKQAKLLQDSLVKAKTDSSKYKEYNRISDSIEYYKSKTSQYTSPEMAGSYNDSLAKWQGMQNVFKEKGWDKSLESLTGPGGIQDPLLKNTLDSTQYKRYQQVADSINRYKDLTKQFANLEKYKSQNKDLQKKLDDYEGYLDKVKNTDNLLSQPEIKEQLQKTGILDRTGEVFGKVQKLGIGRLSLNLSDFTIRNQNIYGFNFDYLIKNIFYTGVGLGLTTPNNFQFNMSFNTQQWSKFGSPKFIGYLRLGVGALADDHVHLIYTSYGEKFRPATNSYIYPILPPANSVLALEFRKNFAKTFSFEGELATSNSNFMKRSATFAPFEVKNKNAGFNYAAKALLSGSIKKSATVIAAKLNLVSANFMSAGNMFSRRDYLESGLTLSQQIVAGKLNLTQMVNYNTMGLFSGKSKFSTIMASNTLTVVPFAKGRYNITYTTVKQFGSSMSNTEMHSTGLQQQYNYGKKKVQGITTISSMYMYMVSGTSEQRFKGHQVQNSIQQTIVFPKNTRLLLGGGVNYSENKMLPSQLGYWAETGNSFTIKSAATISYSVKYLKDNLNMDNIFANTAITATICKGLQTNLRAQVQVLAGARPILNMNITGGLNYTFQYSFLLKAKKNNGRKGNPALDFSEE